MIKIVLVLLVFLFSRKNDCSRVTVEMETPREDLELELERQLQSLNKPPVKTMELEGDIIDCIDINHQPALDHPLLKNHKIQLSPTSIPESGTKKSGDVNEPLQAGFKAAACPDGTVPIHRTTKEDLIRAKNLAHQMFANLSQTNAMAPNVQQVFIKLNGSMLVIRFTGLLGDVAIYNLNMPEDQSSASHVWVDSGRPYYITRLIAGCLVSQSINYDTIPRLFIYWTLDADKTGCFNSLCQGFVQVDRHIGPQTRFNPISSFGGTIYDCKLSIYQDSVTKNWWLVVSSYNVAVGYWPKEIVPNLENGAGDVGWGGLGMAQVNENAPPVGSGQFPGGSYQNVGYFRNVHFMKDGVEPRVPTDDDPVSEYPGDTRCYGLQNDKDTKNEFWGYRFAFGGPGGPCN